MDVIVETQEGVQFTIEVHILDTVLEIKEKVQKSQGIPIDRQTLVFNGQVLQDDRVYEIVLNPHIQLIVTPEHDIPQVNIEQSFPMDVIVETQEGTQFTIEVHILDTVLEIKETVQKNQGIPIDRQTLVLNGQVLQDDRVYEIVLNPHIQLIVTPEHDIPQVNIEQSFPSKKIQLNIKIGSSEASVPLEMDVNDTVLQLKEKIQVMELLLPAHTLVAQSNGVELQDHLYLRDYELADNTEIHINARPLPTSSRAEPVAREAAAGPERLKVMVLTRSGTEIPVEVNASDIVEELRKKLDELEQSPREGYFFIHKQNVMEEDQSFRWHQVSEGDKIELFPGFLTEGKKVGRS